MNLFSDFQKNIEDTIYEGTVKLGYMKGKSINIYYDKELLLHLLGGQERRLDDKSLAADLKKFQLYIKASWGDVLIEQIRGRFQVTIPPMGVECIYEKNKENHFLRNLLDVLSRSDCSIDQIVEIFRAKSLSAVCESIKESEFQYMIHFQDQSVDEYKYCFTCDEMGFTYHRFIGYDYDRIVKEQGCGMSRQ